MDETLAWAGWFDGHEALAWWGWFPNTLWYYDGEDGRDMMWGAAPVTEALQG